MHLLGSIFCRYPGTRSRGFGALGVWQLSEGITLDPFFCYLNMTCAPTYCPTPIVLETLISEYDQCAHMAGAAGARLRDANPIVLETWTLPVAKHLENGNPDICPNVTGAACAQL